MKGQLYSLTNGLSKMRCVACDKLLSDYETSLRSLTTDEYMDMCEECLDTISDDVAVYSLKDPDEMQEVSDGTD